jgi:hypothetical protein
MDECHRREMTSYVFKIEFCYLELFLWFMLLISNAHQSFGRIQMLFVIGLTISLAGFPLYINTFIS